MATLKWTRSNITKTITTQDPDTKPMTTSVREMSETEWGVREIYVHRMEYKLVASFELIKFDTLPLWQDLLDWLLTGGSVILNLRGVEGGFELAGDAEPTMERDDTVLGYYKLDMTLRRTNQTRIFDFIRR